MVLTLQTYAVSLEKSPILSNKMSGRVLYIRLQEAAHTHVQACTYVCMDTRLLIQAERTCSFKKRKGPFKKGT